MASAKQEPDSLATTSPYPWHALPKISRQMAAGLCFWAERCGRLDSSDLDILTILGSRVAARPQALETIASERFEQEVGDDAVLLVSTWDTQFGLIVASTLAQRLCAAVLGQPALTAAWAAPRPLSPAERGVLTYVVVSTLSALDPKASVLGFPALPRLAAQFRGEDEALTILPVHLGLGLELDGEPMQGLVRVLLPQGVTRASPRAAEVIPHTRERCIAFLDRHQSVFDFELARTRIPCAALAKAGKGDVILFPQGMQPRLRTGQGGFALAISPLRIASPFCREDPMNETVLEELSVEVTAEVGRIRMNAREAMALAPGAIIDFAQPLGRVVDLFAGGQLLGRGEMVDVEGTLGVRVTHVVAR